LFHLVLGSHDGRALVPIPKRSAYPASDLDVVVVDSLKALDPNRRTYGDFRVVLTR